jgi:hypothetical protein
MPENQGCTVEQSLCQDAPPVILPNGIALLATVCNTVLHAVPFTLRMARGHKQYLVDMSEALDQRGDAGLTGMVWYQDKLRRRAVQRCADSDTRSPALAAWNDHQPGLR